VGKHPSRQALAVPLPVRAWHPATRAHRNVELADVGAGGVRPGARALLHVGADGRCRVPGHPQPHRCAAGGPAGRPGKPPGSGAAAPPPDGAGRPCPTGYADRRLVLEASAGALKVQAEGSPPVVDRALAHGVDAAHPVATFRRARAAGCPACAARSAPAPCLGSTRRCSRTQAATAWSTCEKAAPASFGSAGCRPGARAASSIGPIHTHMPTLFVPIPYPGAPRGAGRRTTGCWCWSWPRRSAASTGAACSAATPTAPAACCRRTAWQARAPASPVRKSLRSAGRLAVSRTWFPALWVTCCGPAAAAPAQAHTSATARACPRRGAQALHLLSSRAPTCGRRTAQLVLRKLMCSSRCSRGDSACAGPRPACQATASADAAGANAGRARAQRATMMRCWSWTCPSGRSRRMWRWPSRTRRCASPCAARSSCAARTGATGAHRAGAPSARGVAAPGPVAETCCTACHAMPAKCMAMGFVLGRCFQLFRSRFMLPVPLSEYAPPI